MTHWLCFGIVLFHNLASFLLPSNASAASPARKLFSASPTAPYVSGACLLLLLSCLPPFHPVCLQHNVKLQLTYLDVDAGEESRAAVKDAALLQKALQPVPQRSGPVPAAA